MLRKYLNLVKLIYLVQTTLVQGAPYNTIHKYIKMLIFAFRSLLSLPDLSLQFS